MGRVGGGFLLRHQRVAWRKLTRNGSTSIGSLVPRPSAIISVGGKDGLVNTVRACAYIPLKVGNGN